MDGTAVERFLLRNSHVGDARLASTSRFLLEGARQPSLLLGSGSGPLGKPPANRGTVPPGQDGDRIYSGHFMNPNRFTYVGANRSSIYSWRNKIGYRTYVQFLLDFGRDRQVASGLYSAVSTQHPLCPRTTDTVRGNSFDFPPATQPMHACRRAIIAALDVISDRNVDIPNSAHRDWVSVITFDSRNNGVMRRHLLDNGHDYQAAMDACVDLQATSDVGFTTTTDAGLADAAAHLTDKGRSHTDKVVVLLTDGAPNDWITPTGDVQTHLTNNPTNPNYYRNGGWWLDAALMQTELMQGQGYRMFPVGIGLGTNYDFMDRLARLGDTADDNGQSPRGSGNPADYEQRLIDIFETVVLRPKVHLVD